MNKILKICYNFLNNSIFIEQGAMKNSGFTFIELSIVLVIIGLVVGGILMGQDLINAATVLSQISQIGKYNTAVHVFESKYGYLPGDIPDPYASNFGFQARGQYDGEGDGDGALRGNCVNAPSSAYNHNLFVGCGELAVFWVDLSTAGLIDAAITSGGSMRPRINDQPSSSITLTTSPTIKDWLPAAKLGQGTYIYVDSIDHINYFTVSAVTKIGMKLFTASNPGITVQQAYNIDRKMDDGLPQSGSVNACFLSQNVADTQFLWAAGGGLAGASGGSTENGSNNCNASTAATAYLSTNCYDNSDVNGNGVAGATQAYQISKNGTAQNCALSFKFQ